MDLAIARSKSAPVSIEELKNSTTPMSSGRHYPIAHYDLYEEVMHSLEEAGAAVYSEQHAVSHDGSRYFGLLNLAPSDGANTQFTMTVGLRNSHDKRFRAGICFGNRVLVCDNLCFSGEAVIGRRHTRNIYRDLPRLVWQCVSQLNDHYEETESRMTAYRQRMLSGDEARALTVRAVEGGVLPPSKILKVLAEFEEPTYPEHLEEDGGSLWTLQNAFTEVQKGRNIFELPRTQETLKGLLDVTAGIVGGKKYTEVVG